MTRIHGTVGVALALWLAANGPLAAEWRRVGNAAIDLRLSGVATGPVEGVGWSQDGGTLFARSAVGAWLSSPDGESWTPAGAAPVEPEAGFATRLPTAGARLIAGGRAGLVYAYGEHVWRSEDGGSSWRNLTQWKATSLLGGPVSGLAVRPGEPEQILAAVATGMWRSTDGGLSWSSLNGNLPLLPVRRIVSLPGGSAGVRVAMLAPAVMTPAVFEWAPGERDAWQSVPGHLGIEQAAKSALSREFQTVITALAYSGDVIYAGSQDGRVFVSLDRGATWPMISNNPGASVEAFAIDSREPRRAVVAYRRSEAGPVISRTTNGGLVWDAIGANLGQTAVLGVTADFVAGVIYVATPGGIFTTASDLTAMGPPTQWRKVETNLPDAPVFDVKLDAAGQFLYAAVFGYGVYSDAAPHRRKDWKIVSSADWMARPAAPGALLSILGSSVRSVRAGEKPAAVLNRTTQETQVQLPFDIDGPTVDLALEVEDGLVRSRLPLAPAAPAILVDRDGTAMLMDGASGAMLDSQNPARAGSTVQILASGLGRVQPDWPVGIPAPAGGSADSLPSVITPVRGWLDGVPLEVVRATLAPGYVGYYLVEVRLPDIVNAGPAELFLEASNSQTNRVRLYIEP